jgi:hypothetical protein
VLLLLAIRDAKSQRSSEYREKVAPNRVADSSAGK